MKVNDETKAVYIDTANGLKDSDRRLFMARVVNCLGKGGHRQAAREFGGTRALIRKGQHELASGIVCLPGYSGRGRKRAEERFPQLLEDIKAIADGQSQTDARFEGTPVAST